MNMEKFRISIDQLPTSIDDAAPDDDDDNDEEPVHIRASYQKEVRNEEEEDDEEDLNNAVIDEGRLRRKMGNHVKHQVQQHRDSPSSPPSAAAITKNTHADTRESNSPISATTASPFAPPMTEEGGEEKAWSFHEWLASHQTEQEKHRKEVFERVKDALTVNGDDEDDSDSGNISSSSAATVANVSDPMVQMAWEKRLQIEAQKREQEDRRQQEQQQVNDLDDLFEHIREEESNLLYTEGGFAGLTPQQRSASRIPNHSQGRQEGSISNQGLTLDVGMDEADLDDLIASLVEEAAANGGITSSTSSLSELGSVLLELEQASNNKNTHLHRSVVNRSNRIQANI